ncbi:MAG TPA: hypothetical protein ENN63_05640 [Bacteroidetes bacterium]|nr:hypothetical protein [Bacteroidota bacterium]
MKIYHIATLILLTLAGILRTGAQQPDEFPETDRMDRLNAQKIAFFTNRMQLTPEESEKFWPVYNEYQKKRTDIQEQRRQLQVRYAREQSKLNDAEILQMTDQFIELQVEETELAREYHEKFKQVLPIRKVLRLYHTENQYKTFLLRQLRERAANIRQGPRR